MICHRDLRIPRHCHEQRVNPAIEGRDEDVRDLQADDERKGDHHGREGAVAVVRGRREDEVEVRQEGAGVGDEAGAHGEDGADEAFVDEGVDATLLNHAVGG